MLHNKQDRQKARAEKRAAALRENLKRRKAQQQERNQNDGRAENQKPD